LQTALMFASCKDACCALSAEGDLTTGSLRVDEGTRAAAEAEDRERQRREKEAVQKAFKEQEEEQKRRAEAQAAEADTKRRAEVGAKGTAEEVTSAPQAPPPKTAEEPAFQDKMYQEAVAKMTSPPENVPGTMKRRPSSENISFDEYTKKHAAVFESVLALEKEDGWTFHKEDQGVKVYSKAMPGQPFLYFKGVSVFTCKDGPLDLATKITTIADRPKWDEMCELGVTPQSMPPFYRYAYTRLKPPNPVIAGREMVSLGRMCFDKDGAIVFAIKSDTHPDHPEVAGIVRASFIEGGYVIRPVEGDPTAFRVTYTGCVDPKGWIPTWLANLVVKKQALALAKLKGHVQSAQK